MNNKKMTPAYIAAIVRKCYAYRDKADALREKIIADFELSDVDEITVDDVWFDNRDRRPEDPEVRREYDLGKILNELSCAVSGFESIIEHYAK